MPVGFMCFILRQPSLIGMATHFFVSDSEYDEDTLSRKVNVRIGTSGNVKFKTPMKAGLGNVTEIPFYEAHKKIRPETIMDCLKSEQRDREHGRELKRRCKGDFNVLTLEYDSKDVVPTDRMVVAMSDMQYNNTDAITTPSWFDLITRKNSVDVQLYLHLSGVFLEAASVRNKKPIFGTIPQSIPPEKLEKVLKFYIDRDVTSFVVDSHGRTLISGSWIRALHRTLDAYNIENECILYTMNAFQGVVPKTKTAIEAKDFIGFTAGFDIMGGKHSNKYPDKPTDEEAQAVGRAFDRQTYNYEKRMCTKEEKVKITEQSIRNQNAEFSVVGEAISEKTVKPLLMTKDLAPETLNTILSFRQGRHNMKIDDFI